MKTGFNLSDPLDNILAMVYKNKKELEESLGVTRPTLNKMLEGEITQDQINHILKDCHSKGVFPKRMRLERLFKLRAQ